MRVCCVNALFLNLSLEFRYVLKNVAGSWLTGQGGGPTNGSQDSRLKKKRRGGGREATHNTMIAEEGRCRMSTMTCYRSVGCDRCPTGARGLNPRADVCAWCAEIAATDLLGVAGIFLVHERSLFSLCAGMRE